MRPITTLRFFEIGLSAMAVGVAGLVLSMLVGLLSSVLGTIVGIAICVPALAVFFAAFVGHLYYQVTRWSRAAREALSGDSREDDPTSRAG